jgi:hypothetical protein
MPDDIPGSGGSGFDFIGGKRVVVGAIEIDTMPDPSRLRQWKIDLIEKIADSCPHGFAWIKELDHATSIEDLKGKNPYPALESRVAQAVKKCIRKNEIFHSKMTRLIEVGHQTGNRVMSREILFHMYAHLRPNVRGENLYDLRDLLEVNLGASKTKCTTPELEQFLIRWDTVISGIGRLPDDDTLHTLFYKQVKDIEILDYDMKGYDRLPETERTIEKLRVYCDRVIEINRAEDNQRRRHGRSAQDSPRVAAPGPHARSGSGSRPRGRSQHRSTSRKRSTTLSPRGTMRRRSTGKRVLSSERMCVDFIKGRCARGAGCKYSHDKDGKRKPSSSRDRNKPRPSGERRSSPGTLRVGVLLHHHSRVRILVTCLQLANAILAPIADTVMINLLHQLLPLQKRHSVLLIALRQTRSD